MAQAGRPLIGVVGASSRAVVRFIADLKQQQQLNVHDVVQWLRPGVLLLDESPGGPICIGLQLAATSANRADVWGTEQDALPAALQELLLLFHSCSAVIFVEPGRHLCTSWLLRLRMLQHAKLSLLAALRADPPASVDPPAWAALQGLALRPAPILLVALQGWPALKDPNGAGVLLQLEAAANRQLRGLLKRCSGLLLHPAPGALLRLHPSRLVAVEAPWRPASLDAYQALLGVLAPPAAGGLPRSAFEPGSLTGQASGQWTALVAAIDAHGKTPDGAAPPSWRQHRQLLSQLLDAARGGVRQAAAAGRATYADPLGAFSVHSGSSSSSSDDADNSSTRSGYTSDDEASGGLPDPAAAAAAPGPGSGSDGGGQGGTGIVRQADGGPGAGGGAGGRTGVLLERVAAVLEAAAGGGGVQLSAEKCRRAVEAARAVYLQGLPPRYPEAVHRAAVAAARDSYQAASCGPCKRRFQEELMCQCGEEWRSGRQQCSATSLTGRPCALAPHSEAETPHSSAAVWPLASSCGRWPAPLPDPFTFAEANRHASSPLPPATPPGSNPHTPRTASRPPSAPSTPPRSTPHTPAASPHARSPPAPAPGAEGTTATAGSPPTAADEPIDAPPATAAEAEAAAAKLSSLTLGQPSMTLANIPAPPVGPTYVEAAAQAAAADAAGAGSMAPTLQAAVLPQSGQGHATGARALPEAKPQPLLLVARLLQRQRPGGGGSGYSKGGPGAGGGRASEVEGPRAAGVGQATGVGGGRGGAAEGSKEEGAGGPEDMLQVVAEAEIGPWAALTPLGPPATALTPAYGLLHQHNLPPAAAQLHPLLLPLAPPPALPPATTPQSAPTTTPGEETAPSAEPAAALFAASQFPTLAEAMGKAAAGRRKAPAAAGVALRQEQQQRELREREQRERERQQQAAEEAAEQRRRQAQEQDQEAARRAAEALAAAQRELLLRAWPGRRPPGARPPGEAEDVDPEAEGQAPAALKQGHPEAGGDQRVLEVPRRLLKEYPRRGGRGRGGRGRGRHEAASTSATAGAASAPGGSRKEATALLGFEYESLAGARLLATPAQLGLPTAPRPGSEARAAAASGGLPLSAASILLSHDIPVFLEPTTPTTTTPPTTPPTTPRAPPNPTAKPQSPTLLQLRRIFLYAPPTCPATFSSWPSITFTLSARAPTPPLPNAQPGATQSNPCSGPPTSARTAPSSTPTASKAAPALGPPPASAGAGLAVGRQAPSAPELTLQFQLKDAVELPPGQVCALTLPLCYGVPASWLNQATAASGKVPHATGRTSGSSSRAAGAAVGGGATGGGGGATGSVLEAGMSGGGKAVEAPASGGGATGGGVGSSAGGVEAGVGISSGGVGRVADQLEESRVPIGGRGGGPAVALGQSAEGGDGPGSDALVPLLPWAPRGQRRWAAAMAAGSALYPA